MPAPEDLSAAFGTPTLPVARALHALAGGGVKITRALSFELIGFFTRTQNLAVRSPAQFPLRAQALEANGSGRAYGMQILLRQELWKGLFGWIAYSFTRSERRDHSEGLPPDGSWRLFDFDQTHVLTVLFGYALPDGWQMSARLRYASGFPRTPIVDVYFDSTNDRYQPVLGAHNGIRLPAFVQLDARLAKVFAIRTTRLELAFEVLNVWNHRNVEEFVYSSDYSRRGAIRGFPVLPSLAVRWQF
jgi:hypothetical protein